MTRASAIQVVGKNKKTKKNKKKEKKKPIPILFFF
jgi:hypothetical protein